jgi:hypothetical protein
VADEISFNAKLTLTNSSLKDTFDFRKNLIDQTASGLLINVWTVGTSEETLTVTDIGTLGVAYFLNLDPTNYVQLGVSTGVYFCRLKPAASDMPAMFRLEPGVTIYGKANTSACKVLVGIYEN